ncbi:MAG: hypothetical protein AABX47_04350 [Nanoarchaeota archaeon]
MICALCKSTIEKYDPTLNHLVIDESCSADICQGCIDKFFKWQQGLYARLFPTKAMKKRVS